MGQVLAQKFESTSDSKKRLSDLVEHVTTSTNADIEVLNPETASWNHSTSELFTRGMSDFGHYLTDDAMVNLVSDELDKLVFLP